jgi:hypothetical protein
MPWQNFKKRRGIKASDEEMGVYIRRVGDRMRLL